MSEPTIIILHPADWHDAEGFYDEILSAAHAPEWHGRNLDALADSLVTGRINGIEPPLQIRVSGIESAPPFACKLIEKLESITKEATAQGRPIEVVRC